jgi:hypothetical protein
VGREVKLVGAEAKVLKHRINSSADRAEALVAADPRRIVVT